MREGLKMFDLNVDVALSVVDTSTKCDRNGCATNGDIAVKKKEQEDRQSGIHSGTSVSSDVLNVTVDVDVDDEDSVSYTALHKQACHIVSQTGESMENSNRASAGLITRQFFSCCELFGAGGGITFRINNFIPVDDILSWSRLVKSQGSGICAGSSERESAAAAEGKENPEGTTV